MLYVFSLFQYALCFSLFQYALFFLSSSMLYVFLSSSMLYVSSLFQYALCVFSLPVRLEEKGPRGGGAADDRGSDWAQEEVARGAGRREQRGG